MLKRLFGRPGARIGYERAKAMARDGDAAVRAELARRQDALPELLYYLAADPAREVRRAIAGNAATPGQANLLLAQDGDDEVRCELARKIARLLPELAPEAGLRLREMALEALELLARDQLPRVRAALSEAIKSSDAVPPHLVKRLAADAEAIVAAPVLEYSPLLSGADLLELVAVAQAAGALEAIARRQALPESVADAVVATLDAPAVAALLANPSARIRAETLEGLADRAEAIEAWHEPLVFRPDLSLRAIRRIARFVAGALIQVLSERHDLDEATQGELRARVAARIEAPAAAADSGEAGILAAVDAGKRDAALGALARASGLAAATVRRIVASRQPKAVVALAWKAGLSMRGAMRLQARLALIPPKQVLNARRGIDYPLAEEELELQLGLFA